MGSAEPVFSHRPVAGHTALVLVANVDRRLLPALQFVVRLPHTEARALHVSVDAEQTRRLVSDWLRLGLTWMPLRISEAPAGQTIPAAVCDAVRREVAGGAGRTFTVVVPELESPRWWHPLLHRGRARAIAAHLQGLPGVTTVVVPFSLGSARSRGAGLPS